MKYLSYFTCLSILFCFSCKSNKVVTENKLPKKQGIENPTSNFEKPDHGPNVFDLKNLPSMTSEISVNYRIHKKAIKDTFNLLLDQYIIENVELPKVNVQVSLEKYDDANLEFSEKDVLITLPLNINLSKETFLKNLKANGQLELQFVSQVDIDSSWNLMTQTKMFDYRWIEKPQLDIGLVQLPIEHIATMLIERIKSKLEEQIDRSIREEFSLRQKVLNVLQYIETPLETDPSLGIWMQLNPEMVKMTGILNSEEWSSGIVQVNGSAKLFSEKLSPNIAGIQLPKFQWQEELNDTSHLFVFSDITYAHIDQQLKLNFVNQTFREADKEITIEDIAIGKEDDHLVVHAKSSGSFNGTIIIKAKPKFDKGQQSFYAEDMKIKLKTNNVLHKAAAWMLKGKIKSQIEEMCKISIKDHLDDFQQKIDDQITKFKKEDGLEIASKIQNVSVTDFILDGDRIHAMFDVGFTLNIDVYDFNKLEQNMIFPKLKK